MDVLEVEVLALGMTGSGGGGLGQGLFQVLELCGRHESVGHLTTLSIIVKSPFDLSPHRDDATWAWDIQDQVGVMRDYHELRECRPSQESIVHNLKIGDLKL
jgi:hypothetical protein